MRTRTILVQMKMLMVMVLWSQLSTQMLLRFGVRKHEAERFHNENADVRVDPTVRRKFLHQQKSCERRKMVGNARLAFPQRSQNRIKKNTHLNVLLLQQLVASVKRKDSARLQQEHRKPICFDQVRVPEADRGEQRQLARLQDVHRVLAGAGGGGGTVEQASNNSFALKLCSVIQIAGR